MRRAIDSTFSVAFAVVAGWTFVGASQSNGLNRWLLFGSAVVCMIAAVGFAIRSGTRP